MRNAIIIGIGSDIGTAMSLRLIRDDWRITGTYRHTKPDFSTAGPLPHAECVALHHQDKRVEFPGWDLLMVCIGTLEPIRGFVQSDAQWAQWLQGFGANFLLPLNIVRNLLPVANPNALVVFFAGTNPNKPAVNYSSYHLAKIALIAATEQLDAECKERFVCLGPGFMSTKIHKPHDVSGYAQKHSYDDLYDLLQACLIAPKEWLGRNLHIDDDLAVMMKSDNGKLRRNESR